MRKCGPGHWSFIAYVNESSVCWHTQVTRRRPLVRLASRAATGLLARRQVTCNYPGRIGLLHCYLEPHAAFAAVTHALVEAIAIPVRRRAHRYLVLRLFVLTMRAPRFANERPFLGDVGSYVVVAQQLADFVQSRVVEQRCTHTDTRTTHMKNVEHTHQKSGRSRECAGRLSGWRPPAAVVFGPGRSPRLGTYRPASQLGLPALLLAHPTAFVSNDRHAHSHTFRGVDDGIP